MGNTKDTGYLRELVTYDESNNVTFPANVSAVAPAGSDNSTKVPSTAWVRTYVSGVASLSTSGTSGANGSSGSSGQTGAAGSSGSSGSSGNTGAAGSSGSSGSSGQTGAAGSSGSSGSSGQTGAAGSSGSSGSSGNTGAAGATGSSGSSGSSGNTGSPGSPGAAGTSGSSGNTGAAGSSGSSGNTGAAGSPGAAGTSGSSGNTGAAGSSGSSGNTGAAGAAGTSGSSGSSGNTGAPGAAGTSGSSGSSGQTGAAGSSGSSGQTGGAGSSGTSGTSPSAAAFVAKAGDTMTGLLQISGQATINTTTPGVGNYGLHFTGQTTADYAAGITWNGGTGTTGAQAGIYVQGAGAYGTKMYIATTDSYATGSKNAISIDHMGLVNFIRAVPTYAGTSLVYNSGTWGISISGNATTATNFNNGSSYSSGASVYVDTLESINSNDWLELTYYGGLGVRIGTGVNGSKALYAGSLYDAGNRVYSAANPQVNISGSAGYSDYVAAQTNPIGNFNVGLSRPKGASYTTTASTVTGAIKIKMPVGVPVHGMWKMTVKIYEYGQRGNGYTIELGCHLYPSTAHNRYQWMLTTDTGAVLPIRYGTDGTSGCVWIGENGTVWSYPQIHVTEFSNGFNNPGGVNWTTGTWGVTIGAIDNSVAVDGPYTTSLIAASYATNSTNLSGLGTIQSTSTGTSYSVNYQIRENSGGGGNTNEIYAPQLGFHWSGVVASSIMMEASGRIAIRNNPGGSYENFIANDVTASSNLTARSNTTSGAPGGVINLGGSSADPAGLGNSGILGLTWGLRGDSQAYYMVKSTSQTFGSYTYNRLDLSWHTGIIMGANPVYGGIRMYNDSLNVATTILFSVGNGDNNVRASNDIIAFASDRRLKHNIQPIENAISKVNSLTGMTYQWNDVGSKHGWDPNTEIREAGVFAQDVQEVLPEAVRLAPFDDEMGVSKSGENFLTVKYEKLVPLVIEAIKEQQTQIEDQALEIRRLKSLIGSLLGTNLK